MPLPSLSGPDLQLLVRGGRDKSGPVLVFQIGTPAQGFREFRHPLIQDPISWVSKVLNQVKAISHTNRDLAVIAEQRISLLGTRLFEQLLPRELQEFLTQPRRRTLTIQILSEEVDLPWELLKLPDTKTRRGLYLGEALVVTRWLHGLQPVLRFPLSRIAFIETRHGNLPTIQALRQELSALATSEHKMIQIGTTRSEAAQAFDSEEYDGWYFHARVALQGDTHSHIRLSLVLDDGTSLLPEDLGTTSLLRTRPLVFFNVDAQSATSVNPWAHRFLAAGAGAFIAPLWSVRDQEASAFAKAFYIAFLAGVPLGEAVRSARLELRRLDPASTAWLAYTAFAHPHASCGPADTTTHHAPVKKRQLLYLPRRPWQANLDPPSALLRSEYGVVPFHRREKELQDLYAWCMDSAPVRIRLYTSPGGMGKTRLAIEIALRLRVQGWDAGFLPSQQESFGQIEELIQKRKGNILLIIDYAEARRDLLLLVLRRLRASERGPIRVLVLARAALDWWEQLKTEGEGVGELLSGPATSRHSIAPIAFSLKGRAQSFFVAAQAFSNRLNLPCPLEEPEDLAAPYFERILILHMAALISVLGETAAKSENGVLDHVLIKERVYWANQLHAAGLSANLLAGMSRFAATVTLAGGVADEAGAIKLLSHIHEFKAVPADVLVRVANIFHGMYPGDRWIAPVPPQLLGEHLVERELEKGADELFDLVLGPPE